MVELTELYQWLHSNGVLMFDRKLAFSNQRTRAIGINLCEDDTYGIFVDFSRIESRADEKATMLHECGHYATGATHKVSSRYDLIEKHEYKADKWAIKRALSPSELDQAIAEGCENIWELAEHFGVTEDLMRKAVSLYTYGNLDCKDYLPM
ncbi:ImmA/IrrE family metallo-endopeptidase [uncultured Oscillibacter sp.]|uniref:ImmA/IrrE family metallo-endopeptidase n=1 Tax=uncultured Oscillibacter sp. TaxID=876091 RepID=UPI0025F0C4BF|nr:ImmA/IrrE family metallo-endopeptidase [uncultured Oscillibacter sp.]